MSPAFRLAFIASGAGLVFFAAHPATASAAKNSDQAHEYAEARKIALKDPKVQAAYQRADEKLEERILEIDPTLKPYVDRQKGRPAPATTPAKAAPASKPAKSSATPAVPTTHVVAKGETFSSIAHDYKVSVASLKSANSTVDERKLRVGQTLVIPAATATPAKHHEEPPKKEPSLWDRLQSSF